MKLLDRWHDWMDLEKHDKAWHERDLADEIQERNDAEGFWERWAELGDVVYTLTRARWAGHSLQSPVKRGEYAWGLLHMLPKYTLRNLFYRKIGRVFGKELRVIRNPAKPEKLRDIAEAHGIHPEAFLREAERAWKWWPKFE